MKSPCGRKGRMPVFTAFNGIWSLTFVVGGVIKMLITKGEFYGRRSQYE
jgi:hypothetical protein